MKDVYLSIGTNIGERYENLQQAVALLREKENIEVVRVSSVYETAAVGYTDQADFLNIAVHLKTDASSTEMLKICQSIEQELGRVREFRWGPRIIDLDILLYNQENIETENLLVPHPRMYERAFVLVPLVEITPAPFGDQLQQAHHLLQQMDRESEGINLWQPTNEPLIVS
ncbi:2-amino-4-hydroxy-6-hydroxymethyldihydropteridine diphosphokinase [Lysinibacillus fusiformis]|jgi:2-amino-4-hydroxy-6-hydroxymethyldihydropteridine diphosphokinase|uniref:2-amino-4-hydroxy-6- hydroxymethyldihydropteridine diphosphokinase n=1 Tax=Lysinibacillus TaxID=400634 RepID=UPI0004D8462C|nr:MULTISPECIES: 2-amino-4-hydroxy-6-hydroxymethyldihydropteridine diphosphokinase [Lysinibacillus]MDC6270576.1 2-amino-4-hydroxy-6-hydroxymethyldihydropteridine diphosphokinase [Lysinibacillus sphaericus]AJK89843.1 2-amino-4-hydroxy-6-hydroxymethyldihydropteridine pyrophosphokinase [Lysinibacillus fusiformis]KGA80139.1 2-amino-4-hydroxy-6-hydroxymethyldihydropteridine pyrophosphokinase [Lysinibacillus fusiformis]KHK50966.1 2-amino-4-hydroxy-6-hydroxymethyldihydropteridine pyrophosphokinase [Ly